MKTSKISFATVSLLIAPLALFGIFGIQYVAAQTATSTDATSTTSDAAASTTAPDAGSAPTTTPATTTSTDSGTAADTATTTTESPSSASSEPGSTSTPPASTETQPSALAESSSAADATPSITLAARDEIAGLEETYRRQTGKYLQIQPGNALPSYESGTVSEKLGKTIPDNVRVDIYEAATGRGYQISYEDNGTLYSVGYGPEAAERTFTVKPSVIVSATSTPQ